MARFFVWNYPSSNQSLQRPMKLPNITGCDMEGSDCLPILLVSAKNEEAATSIISDILNSNPELKAGAVIENQLDCLWRITNKYYTANVRVLALLDGDQLAEQLTNSVEAHLIYLTNEECTGAVALETVQRRAGAGSAAQVRLVAADARAEPPALAAACARAALELVPLQEPEPQDEDDDDFDVRGMQRVREALQAHMWPGLKRLGLPGWVRSTGLSTRSDGAPDSSDDEWSEWMEGPRAEGGGGGGGSEAYLAALARLPGATAAARDAAGSREERLARAEQLVTAFCLALGTPLD